jgi:hypothetical protein
MKHIPHSILTYDRLEESQKTPQLKQIVKNIELTNDYIYEFEQKIEKEPSDKTKNNLDSLRTLLKSQEKEFFSIVMKIKKQNKMKELNEPPKEKKSRAERLKELGAKHLSNEEFLEMVRVWTEYKKNKQTENKALAQEPATPPATVAEKLPKKQYWLESSIFLIGAHIVQLLIFYFIVAVCLWELNPANWNAYLRLGVIVSSYILTNISIIYFDKIDKFLK